MKYVLIIPDGMADYRIDELDNNTPLQYADTPNIDRLATQGIIGTAKTIPEGLGSGSDVAVLSVLGYDPKKYYTGRGPLEAAARGVKLKENDIAFRCNLIYSDGENLIDYSAGHITTEEAFFLMKLISDKLETDRIKFYPGISYRHLMKWNNGAEENVDKIICMPPHDVYGKPLKEVLPKGERKPVKILHNLIWDSIEILDNQEINKKRRDKGLNPANMIWPWGQGKNPDLPKFYEKYKINGGVISGVDIVKGIGVYAGLKIINVPGATGYYDTNYEGKAEYCLKALKNLDFCLVHIEATDEAGHNGDLQEKIRAIENVDKKVLGRILEGLESFKENYKLLILPDHYTPLIKRTHTPEPVPFLIYEKRGSKKQDLRIFDEISAEMSALKFSDGYKLMDYFIKES